jgi:hypothetical protein
VAEWLDDTPWRQGHLLPRATTEALGLKHVHAGVDNDTVAMVIAHDCDLNAATAKEPFVEVIVGVEIDRIDGNNAAGKNPRLLDLPISGGTQSLLVRLDAREKTAVKKADLAGHEPCRSAHLTSNERRILQRWLASRYFRHSLPNEFGRRFDSIASGFRKILQRTTSHIRAVFFDLDDGEEIEREGLDDCYSLRIYLIADSEGDPSVSMAEAQRAAADIAKLFREKFVVKNAPQGIELVDVQALSETQITLFDARRLTHWNGDHLSLGTDPQAPLAPQV